MVVVFPLQFCGGRNLWFLFWYSIWSWGISVKTMIYYMPLKTITASKNESVHVPGFTRQTTPSEENVLLVQITGQLTTLFET